MNAGKALEVETGKKAEQEELMNMLLAESSNLKASIILLTQENDTLKRDKTMLTVSAGAEHREQIETLKEEVRELKGKIYQHSSQQGLDLLKQLNGTTVRQNSMTNPSGPSLLDEMPQKKAEPAQVSSDGSSTVKMSFNNSGSNEESKETTIVSPGNELLRNQIKDLNEKLIFANETIALMEERQENKNILPVH